MRAIDGDIFEKKLKDAINMCMSIDTSGLSELKAVLEDVEEMPTIEPEPKWIPCSERLPENGHYYLWCSDMGSVQSDYYWDGFENGMKYGYNIVAWMPLPEPYRAERRTDG